MSKYRTPLQAIRRECLTCMGCTTQDRNHYIDDCPSDGKDGRTLCPLWPFRLGKKPSDQPYSPLKAIRKKCVECAGSVYEANKCTGEMMDDSTCVLHYYHTGRVPHRKGARSSGSFGRQPTARRTASRTEGR